MPIFTARLFSLLLAGGAAPHILKVRDRLKMRGIYTPVGPTEVVEFKPWRHRPDEQFIAHDMRAAASTVDSDESISAIRALADPEPAAGFGSAHPRLPTFTQWRAVRLTQSHLIRMCEPRSTTIGVGNGS